MKFSHFELKHTVIRVINFGGCFRLSCTILVLSPGLSPPQKPLSLCFDRRLVDLLVVGGWEEGQTEPRGSLFLSFAARIPLKYLIQFPWGASAEGRESAGKKTPESAFSVTAKVAVEVHRRMP